MIMHNPSSATVLTKRDISLAIVSALKMWSDSQYSPFLQAVPSYTTMDKEWFEKFIGDWSVARTISKDRQEEVRKLLNTNFRSYLIRDSAKAVDLVTNEIAAKGWSHQSRDEKWSEPISLVSKVAFFFVPENFVPMDRYSRLGVNKLRGKKKDGGQGHLNSKLYECYLGEFENWFSAYEVQINGELKGAWVKELAKNLDCEPAELDRRAFRRKVFDNMLMQLGGRAG